MGWKIKNLAHKKIASLDIEAVISAVRNRITRQQVVCSGENPCFLNLGGLSIPISVIQKLQRIQIHVASSKDVKMDVVEDIAERFHWPNNDVSNLGVGSNKTTILVVSLIAGISLVNGLGNGCLLYVVILPDVPLGV